MHADLIARLEAEALDLHKAAWARTDGGQDCTISAMLAEEAAAALRALTADAGAQGEAVPSLLDAAGSLHSALRIHMIGMECVPQEVEDAYWRLDEVLDASQAAPARMCDCERGHNGLGMAGRECDCALTADPIAICEEAAKTGPNAAVLAMRADYVAATGADPVREISPDATLLAAEMQRRAEGQIRETIGEAHFFGDKHGIEVLQRALANVEALELPTSALAAAMQLPEVRAMRAVCKRLTQAVSEFEEDGHRDDLVTKLIGAAVEAKGRDLGEAMLAAGLAKAWPHSKAGRALAPRPRGC